MPDTNHSVGILPALQDILFELSEGQRAKFCIAVCDDLSQRERFIETISRELKKKRIETLKIKLTPASRDLVETLQRRSTDKKKQVAIVDGFEEMAEDSINFVLSYLNFKRDVLLSSQVPMLFWMSTQTLSKVVARAPDFWSRRAVTQYFGVSPVTSLLDQLFAAEAKETSNVRKDGKIFQLLQKVFSYERELEQITQHSKEVSPIEIDRLMSGIQVGINDLITECHLSNRFEVAFRLWILAGIDRWLARVRRNMKARFAVPVGNLYEERTDILLKVTDKLTRILENYQANLVSRISERRKVNLLGYFTACVEDETQRMFDLLVRDDQIVSRMSPEEFKELAAGDERLQASLFDDIRQKAAEELRRWLESKQVALPKIFSEEEGKILRLLYRGRREASEIGTALGVTEEDAKKKISKLNSKVLLFLGGE